MTDDVGVYSATLAVTLASATQDAVIRYTVDGTEPTASSSAYRGPLSLTSDTTVQARAFV
jgi:chitinase